MFRCEGCLLLGVGIGSWGGGGASYIQRGLIIQNSTGEVGILFIVRLQNSRFRKVRSAVSVILACEAREPHTPVGCVRQENDCWLFMQRIRS